MVLAVKDIAAKQKERDAADPWRWISSAELAEPLPPVAWAVPGLQLGPGRPSSVQAYGSGMKTLAVGSLAISVAAGLSVWGAFPSGRPKRCRWIDYEMGRRASQRRFQRLAFGLGVDLQDLAFDLSALPRMRLTGTGARDAFMRAGDGIDLAVIDACRGATRGVDENDSSIRDHVDLLLDVSERVGVTWIVLHHCSKLKDGHDDERQKGRGSSALFDAWGAVFDLTKETDSIRRVTMTKPHPEAAGPVESFYLEVSDVPDGINHAAGVVVRHKTIEQVHPPKAAEPELDANVERIRIAMRKQAHPATSIDQIVAWAGMKKDPGRVAVHDALGRGVVLRSGPARAPKFTLAELASSVCAETPHTPRGAGRPGGLSPRGDYGSTPQNGGASRGVEGVDDQEEARRALAP